MQRARRRRPGGGGSFRRATAILGRDAYTEIFLTKAIADDGFLRVVATLFVYSEYN
jgi:hypothetical protein